jgi:hypothetical protein
MSYCIANGSRRGVPHVPSEMQILENEIRKTTGSRFSVNDYKLMKRNQHEKMTIIWRRR